MLASGTPDKTARVWDTETWEPRWEFAAGMGWIDSITFSPDSTTIASTSAERESNNAVYLWDAETGAFKGTLTWHTMQVTSVAFQPGWEDACQWERGPNGAVVGYRDVGT